MRGLPSLPAEPVDDGYEPNNLALDVLHGVVVQAGRIDLLRMHDAAKDDLNRQKALLQDEIANENSVTAMTERYNSELDDVDFAFNHADTMLIEGDSVRLISTSEDEGIEGGSIDN